MSEEKKAYDLKDLGNKIRDRLKSEHGLELAEEAIHALAQTAYLGLKDWAKESAALSENKLDDIAAKFYDYADQYVLPQIEKIDLDGEVSGHPV
jgi:hypothetical protein